VLYRFKKAAWNLDSIEGREENSHPKRTPFLACALRRVGHLLKGQLTGARKGALATGFQKLARTFQGGGKQKLKEEKANQSEKTIWGTCNEKGLKGRGKKRGTRRIGRFHLKNPARKLRETGSGKGDQL